MRGVDANRFRQRSPEQPRQAEFVQPAAQSAGPWISTDVLDAPTQRFYAVAVYVVMWAWKLYNWMDSDADSFWLFLKWFAIDTVYFLILPELKIPWLELSDVSKMTLIFIHAALDYALMLNVGVRLDPPIFGL
jgi:nucleoporin POM152